MTCAAAHVAGVASITVDDLGLGEAWSLWWQGMSLDGMSLWGIPILWWGRAGKLAAFVGGMTVILDVIGPEQLRAFGRRVKLKKIEDLKADVGAIGAALMLAFVILPVLVWPIFGRQGARNVIVWIGILLYAFLVFAAYPRILSFLVLGFGRLIENSRSERVVRLLGVVLPLSGFHFDLLAS